MEKGQKRKGRRGRPCKINWVPVQAPKLPHENNKQGIGGDYTDLNLPALNSSINSLNTSELKSSSGSRGYLKEKKSKAYSNFYLVKIWFMNIRMRLSFSTQQLILIINTLSTNDL